MSRNSSVPIDVKLSKSLLAFLDLLLGELHIVHEHLERGRAGDQLLNVSRSQIRRRLQTRTQHFRDNVDTSTVTGANYIY